MPAPSRDSGPEPRRRRGSDMARLILTGDVNLMNVTDPATPFRRVAAEFRAADMVFSNLECCLYAPPRTHSFHNRRILRRSGYRRGALREAGIGAVGVANNVNYGDAAILVRSPASIRPAFRIPARAPKGRGSAPAIVERAASGSDSCSAARSYWPTNHEAGAHDPGIAVLRGAHRISGADAQDSARDPADEPSRHSADRRDVGRCGVLVAKLHGRYRRVTHQSRYRRRLLSLGTGQGHAGLYARHRPRRDRCRRGHRDRSRAALFAGGRGASRPANLLWAGQFFVSHRHGGRAHGDWVGMMVRADVDRTDCAPHDSSSSGTTAGMRPCCALWPTSRRNSRTSSHAAPRTGRVEPGDEVKVVLGTSGWPS